MGVFHAGQVLVMIEFEKCSDLIGLLEHAFPVYRVQSDEPATCTC